MDTRKLPRTATPEQAEKMRKAREEKRLARLEEATALARDQREKGIVPPKTPIKIRNLRDIDKVTREMMTSLANKDGRFTVAEVRVFNTLANIFFKAQETIRSDRAMKELLKEHKASQP